MLTEDGILQGISNSEIKTVPIRIHTNTINDRKITIDSENAVSGGPNNYCKWCNSYSSGDWTVV